MTTTTAASSAISAMGMAAAPMRSDRRSTNVRPASGDRMSNVSGRPGGNCRRARIPARVAPSASSNDTPRPVAKICSVAGAPKARSYDVSGM